MGNGRRMCSDSLAAKFVVKRCCTSPKDYLSTVKKFAVGKSAIGSVVTQVHDQHRVHVHAPLMCSH